MEDKEKKVLGAYGNLVDDVIDTSNDPEASGEGGDECVSAEDYLANPEKYANQSQEPAHDPLGLGSLPEPVEEKPIVVRSHESVAAEEVRYIRQAIQSTGATTIRTSQSCPEVIEHMQKLLSPEELNRVEFVPLNSNIEGARRGNLDDLFGSLRS